MATRGSATKEPRVITSKMAAVVRVACCHGNVIRTAAILDLTGGGGEVGDKGSLLTPAPITRINARDAAGTGTLWFRRWL